MVFNAICGIGAGAYLGIVLGGCGGGKLDAKRFCVVRLLCLLVGVCCD